jgi:UDP-N-acetylglucosamine 2-epimerase (non-hydrolysing)
MRKIVVFMGTRPEAIKMAPVIKALQAAPDMQPIVVNTGQHREMIQQVIDLFDLPVDHDLAVMQPNQTLASLSARLLTSIDATLENLQPDMALVQGDTTTVLMAALACYFRRLSIGHVEAGLRTWNLWAPFPEEANRKLASPLVSLHFAPTDFGRNNLLQEGIDPDRITVTGNTVIDALHIEVKRQEQADVRSVIRQTLDEQIGTGWADKPFVLITGHRRENFGEGFQQICRALGELADRFPDHRFIYPVHLNPNVQKPVYDQLGQRDNIRLCPPQAYSQFIHLMHQCKMVLTDSGGVQEEAPSLGKPVLVMRDTTERPEGIEAGVVRLVGAHADKIIEGVTELLRDEQAYKRMSEAVNPYGDGKAAQRIVTTIREYFEAHPGANPS